MFFIIEDTRISLDLNLPQTSPYDIQPKGLFLPFGRVPNVKITLLRNSQNDCMALVLALKQVIQLKFRTTVPQLAYLTISTLVSGKTVLENGVGRKFWKPLEKFLFQRELKLLENI